MTKVEDNANWSINDMFHELICYCGGRDFQDDATKGLKASILAKARSEGVAEGAEQMAEYIRENCKVIQDREYGQMLAITEDELDPAVLAPTREKA